MNTNPGIFGKKIGMTQLFNPDGNITRCTVVDANAVVVGKRTMERDGYSALVLGFGDAKPKHFSKAVVTSFEKAGAPLKKELREMRCAPEFAAKFELGAKLPISEIFQVGQFVDVQGTTRGRGFTGVVRRWSFAGFVRTHGTHEYRRHGGSIGTNMTPGRTLPNLKMPGQYGNETVSILNLKIVRIMEEEGMILIEGGIPGARDGFVVVRGAIKKKNGGKKALSGLSPQALAPHRRRRSAPAGFAPGGVFVLVSSWCGPSPPAHAAGRRSGGGGRAADGVDGAGGGVNRAVVDLDVEGEDLTEERGFLLDGPELQLVIGGGADVQAEAPPGHGGLHVGDLAEVLPVEGVREPQDRRQGAHRGAILPG